MIKAIMKEIGIDGSLEIGHNAQIGILLKIRPLY
jgi:hypothetical protein